MLKKDSGLKDPSGRLIAYLCPSKEGKSSINRPHPIFLEVVDDNFVVEELEEWGVKQKTVEAKGKFVVETRIFAKVIVTVRSPLQHIEVEKQQDCSTAHPQADSAIDYASGGVELRSSSVSSYP